MKKWREKNYCEQFNFYSGSVITLYQVYSLKTSWILSLYQSSLHKGGLYHITTKTHRDNFMS